MHRPTLILADEPTGNLDPESADRVLALLAAQVREHGAACLLATHSRAAAARADRARDADADRHRAEPDRDARPAAPALVARAAPSPVAQRCRAGRRDARRRPRLFGPSHQRFGAGRIRRCRARGQRRGRLLARRPAPRLRRSALRRGRERGRQSPSPARSSRPTPSPSTPPDSAFRCASSAAMRSSSRGSRRRCCRGRTPAARRFVALDPAAVFLNASAEKRLGGAGATTLSLQTASGRRDFRIAGSVAAGGPPLAVVDIAGAQVALDFVGRLSRIDVRLAPGADRATTIARAAPARRRSRRRRRRGERARVERLARLPRQPDRARAGGDVHRRLPGLLDPGALGRAAPAAARAARACSACRRGSGWPDPGRVGARRRPRQRARPRARRRARGARAAPARRRPRRRLLRRRRAAAARRRRSAPSSTARSASSPRSPAAGCRRARRSGSRRRRR